MQVAADFKGIHMDRHVHVLGRQSMLLVVAEGIHGADEGGDVTAGLTGQVLVDGPEIIVAAGAADGLVDIAGSAVV